MVLPGLPADRHSGVAQGPDPRHNDGLTTVLAPNEHLTGEIGPLTAALSELRRERGHDVPAHPDHSFLPLHMALETWREHGADTAPFHDGLTLLRERYAALGLRQLLPLNRVHVAVRSDRTAAFGGFHHPDQGYRHFQARVFMTRYGDLSTVRPPVPGLAVLDALRAYAHDCLHWGSFRRYVLRDGKVTRTQYGINFRREDGRSYSAPDPASALSTRNIGIVMEGACDREARALTRAVAERHRIEVSGSLDGCVLQEVTGRLDKAPAPLSGLTPEQRAYLTAMDRYEQRITVRYHRFLHEVGGPEGDALHALILSAMVSGDICGLSAWLDSRLGPGAFAAIFMSPGYPGHTTLGLAS